MGTNTDPYQQCEGRYRLTRGIVETLGRARNPFSILTKSTMIQRDLDVLAAAAERTEVRVNFSIGTLDEEVWRISEPGTPPPWRRVEALARLSEAGLPCGVLVAPILPGLSDGEEQLSQVVQACVEAGAVSISSIGLHLRPGVRELFMPWLERERPDLVERYDELYGARNGYLARDEQKQLGDARAGARRAPRRVCDAARAVARGSHPSPHRPRRRRPRRSRSFASSADAEPPLGSRDAAAEPRHAVLRAVAHPARGLLYGNRGCMHDDQGRIRRRYGTRRWIACRLEFRGWERGPKLQPGRFTELFFLDEVTALAAGHRPCALCRRADYVRLGEIWRDAASRPGRRRRDRPPAARRARRARRRARSGTTERRSTTSPTARSSCATASPGSCADRSCCAGRPRATPSASRGRATARRR